MRFRKMPSLLMLAMGLLFALSAWAQQKTVAPTGTGPDMVGRSAHADVAPTFRSACADLKVSAATPGTSAAKPLTQDQVQGLVRDGLGDESGAKLIEQREIDFAPAEDFRQNLKAAGANEAFLDAARAAKPPEAVSAKKPLNQVQVFALLAGGVPSHRVAVLVQERGIDFEPTNDYLQEVRLGGGEDELISALKSAKVTKPESVDPALQARQAEVRQHVARGAELAKKEQYAEAEQELRAALLFDPQNAQLYADLAYVLGQQEKWDDTATAAREALRLHPNNESAHVNLGYVLGSRGDWDGVVAEERQALRLNPDNDTAHVNLGVALGNKGDWDGAIAEYRAALRLSPNYANAHNSLGVALEAKGERRGALEEYRAAYTLGPKDPTYKQNYERLLQQMNK